MRNYILAVMLILSCNFVSGNNSPFSYTDFDNGDDPVEIYSDSDLRTKIQNLDIPFKPKYSRELKEKIENYIKTYRKKTSRVLGLSSIYFPVIEEYLKANSIPDAFKYLPVIETDLNPRAVSPDGALGALISPVNSN